MHNFEDIIEKYKRELIEFSKQIPVHTQEPYKEESVAVFAQQEVPVEREAEENEPEAVITGRVPFADYDEFIAGNQAQGTLRVQVFSANQSFPVPNATVRVYVQLDDGERELFSGLTDIDGVVDNILLPAPDSSVSFDENSTVAPYAVYKVRVERPGFSAALFEGVPVFDSVKSIQPVEMIPLSDSEGRTSIVPQEPETLFGGDR